MKYKYACVCEIALLFLISSSHLEKIEMVISV